MKRLYINHISFILDSMGATREREQPLAASQEREKCKKQILETDTSICNMHILCNGRHDQVAKLAAMNITDAAPLIAIFILLHQKTCRCSSQTTCRHSTLFEDVLFLNGFAKDEASALQDKLKNLPGSALQVCMTTACAPQSNSHAQIAQNVMEFLLPAENNECLVPGSF